MADIRIGQGIDIHPFCDGRPCVIGGVTIPHSKGLKGHSDADVLLHAVVDAILGATGSGDIGTLFPDTDQTLKNADSRIFLRKVHEKVKDEGWKVVNLDCTILAEKPKLNPHVPSMKRIISDILEISDSQIGIKATTTEKLGFIGREEGVLASAVVLIEKNPH